MTNYNICYNKIIKFNNYDKSSNLLWVPSLIWDEVCTVPRHILEKFINYLLKQKCQVICCRDDAQPPPFFGEMPHDWLKERADYYEEVLTDYRAKCSRLQELKKKM